MSFQYVSKNSCQLSWSSQLFSRLSRLQRVGSSSSASLIIGWFVVHNHCTRAISRFLRFFQKKNFLRRDASCPGSAAASGVGKTDAQRTESMRKITRNSLRGGTNQLRQPVAKTMLCVTLSMAGFAEPQHSFAQAYTLTDLGTLGGPDAFAYGINRTGHVVGRADTAKGTTICDGYGCRTNFVHHAFLWTPTTPNGTTGVMQDLEGR